LFIILFGLSIFLLLISIYLRINVNRQKKQYKIPKGKITYSDLNTPEKPFFSKKYRITGKPDYIIRRNDKIIPVELKTSNSNLPKKNHIFQLATYCQLIEDNYNVFVPYGILVYDNKKQFVINYKPELRFELENTIKKMRYLIKNKKISRNHNDLYRCINCSYRDYCDIKLK